MRITQVRVQNFRSIIDTDWVSIEADITTLLGRNESGKTSFLEAIRFFDESQALDARKLHDGNNPPETNRVPIVSLRAELTEDEAANLSGDGFSFETGDEIIGTKYSDGSRSLTTLQGKKLDGQVYPLQNAQDKLDEFWNDFNNLRNKNSGEFRNHFDNNIKSILNQLRNDKNPDPKQFSSRFDNLLKKVRKTPEQNAEIEKTAAGWISELEELQGNFTHLESIDDVSTLFPPIIYHSEFDTIDDQIHVNNIDSEENRTFKNLLQLVGLDIEQFTQLEPHDQNQALDTAQGSITGQVNGLWEQKRVGVDIRYRDNQFMVGLKDTALRQKDSGEERVVNRSLKRPSERSKGFQWFFSFYINLRAETQTEDSDNKIILLDDPAVFLHPEGKKNWLTSIEQLSETSQIIYSSHSPFLIRKEYPNRIRIVEDIEESGTQITESFYESDAMTLEPLRNALGIGLGDSPFVSKRKILVEGVSDYDILIGIATYYRDHIGEDILKWDEVTVMPTNGANNMIQAAKWVASEQFSYGLLLDNDQKGKSVLTTIEQQHHEIDSDRVVFLQKNDGGRNFNIEIEDMFNPKFYVNCLNTAYSGQFDDFEPIEVERLDDDSWLISEQEYEGRKLLNRIESVFEERDLGDPDKILVADEIRSRLSNGRDVSETDVEAFKPVLGKLMSLT